MTDLVTVRCGPCGNWLAVLYREPVGALWLRYRVRRMLDPQTFRPIPSPRPGGYVSQSIGYAPFIGTEESDVAVLCDRCCNPWPMTATGEELLSAAEAAQRGKPQVVIAKPTARLRYRGSSKP